MSPATQSFFHWFFQHEITFTVHGKPTIVSGPPAWFAFIILAWTASWIWAGWDAWRRGKSVGGAIFFIMFAWWPVSILWWRWLRPPVLSAEERDRYVPYNSDRPAFRP